MKHLHQPPSHSLLMAVGPYLLVVMAAINTTAIVAWTVLLDRSIPPHTPVTSSALLFIAAFPGIIVLFLINSICQGFWTKYLIIARGDRLRLQIETDRAQRDAAIAAAVAARLATEKEMQ